MNDTPNIPQAPQLPSMPKRACIITIMFGIESDDTALKVKQAVDNAVKDIEQKKYLFQITESPIGK
jgi:hypothetical protein